MDSNLSNDQLWRPSTGGDMLFQDLHYALRLMQLNPGFTAGVVLVLVCKGLNAAKPVPAVSVSAGRRERAQGRTAFSE